MIFSIRYKELITDKNGNLIDICNDVSYAAKEDLSKVLVEFAEPQIKYPSRYDNFNIQTTALDSAGERLNEILRIPVATFMDDGVKFSIGQIPATASMFTPYLFDLIELQYEEMSDAEKAPFRFAINSVFNENNLPWILADGKMVKIDAVQFEMDLKNKAEALMLELKDAEPKFKPAYDELNKALEHYAKEEYQDSLLYAEKSYESVMKVCLSTSEGNANNLTEQIAKSVQLPSPIKESGFKSNVLMSLPYLRNTLAGHGSGSEEIVVTKEIANLGINLACSLVTYVISEYRRKEAQNNV